MEPTLSPVANKVNSLLSGTRIVKKFMKGANKIHTRFERDYLKLASICDSSKCINFKDTFENHLSYVKSFLKFNENIINQTQSAYEMLKRATLELKSKLSILKVEKKTMKKMKNNENTEDILRRCKELLSEAGQKTKVYVEEAINSHLFALKSVKHKSKVPPSQDLTRKLRTNSSNRFNLNFEQELEESIERAQHSKVHRTLTKPCTKIFKAPEESMTVGLSMKYTRDFSKVFDS